MFLLIYNYTHYNYSYYVYSYYSYIYYGYSFYSIYGYNKYVDDLLSTSYNCLSYFSGSICIS